MKYNHAPNSYFLVAFNKDNVEVILKAGTNYMQMLTARKRQYPGYTKVRIVTTK